ncbi:hypothetical protein ACHQM5_028512 [Ranunculus cassubicifolius]
MTFLWNPWKDVVKCLPYRHIVSRGIWVGDNPLKFSTPVFMVQIAVSTFFMGSLDFLLRPYGAIIIGPRVLGFLDFFRKFIFSHQSLYVLETCQNIGAIFFLFLVGLKMDMRIVYGSGRKELLIGVSAGVAPVLLTTFIAVTFRHFLPPESQTTLVLTLVAMIEAQTSFHVVACLLSDLKILNSEIGRLAIASSMISNTCSWGVLIVLWVVSESATVSVSKALFMLGSIVCLVLMVNLLLKPIMHWMVKQIPQGTNNMEEVHVCVVFLMVLFCSFLGQYMGHPPGVGPIILGLAVPPGPPLAETIEDKLESIVSAVFLPLFYVASTGKGGKIAGLDLLGVMFVELIIALAFLLKIIGTVLPSIYCGVSLNDSIVLGLIIASQGLVDLMNFSRALIFNKLNEEVYTLMVYSSIVIAGITSVLVKLMYKPSMDYVAYKITLGNSMRNTEFRILACIYRDFNVSSIIHLLKASNPTQENPISLYLLHLIELQRLAPPFLISHKKNDDNSIYYNRSKNIINAFRFFEKQNENTFSFNSFSAMSPCVTMHQDICSLAKDKRVAIIILPFHKQFNLDGLLESNNAIRTTNTSVLKFSPCSVGLLIDRRRTSANSSIASSRSYSHILIIFLGGADDREVLTYGMHMVQNSSTTLTVVRFNVVDNKNNDLDTEKEFDVELLKDFQRKYVGKERINYREEMVTDGLGIIKAIRAIEDPFDLIMVGRQRGRESELFNGLSEWNEYPELGFIGDMLATSNSHEDVSILVVQQTLQSSDDRTYTVLV